MSTKRYDIHLHLFNKTIIDRELASLVVQLTEYIRVDDGDKRKVQSILGNVNEFLTRIKSSNAEALYNYCNDAYKKHLDPATYEMVYTPLTFDLTYVDDDDLSGSTDAERLAKIRAKSLRKLKLIANLLIILAPNTNTVLWKDIGKGIKALVKAIKEEDEIINNQNFDNQVIALEELVTKLGSHLKPFYCVEPRQTKRAQNPIDYLAKLNEKILNGVFHGVKLYSPVGFSPTDPVLFAANGVYNYCIQNNVPITAHNSDAGFAAFALQVRINGDVYDHKNRKLVKYNNKIIKFKHDVISLKAGKAISERAEALNHPKIWEKVLDTYPNLTLNLAHFGGSGGLMELVHHDIPKEIEEFSPWAFRDWLADVPQSMQSKITKCYHEPNEVKKKYVLKDMFYPRPDDFPSIAASKDDLRVEFWEYLFDLGKINNWSKYVLDMIESDKYPNLYTDLSAFSEGSVNHFEVPRKHCVLFNGEYKRIRNSITDSVQRQLFEQSYTKVSLTERGLKDNVSYEDHVRLVVIFKNLGILNKTMTNQLDNIKQTVGKIIDDATLITYLLDNHKFSILLDLKAFKEKLFDKLQPRHQEKILYGSDFYFTQVFGPRHEQYVEDFVDVFDADFELIAKANPERFLKL